MEVEDENFFDKLPYEIIVKIFSHLSLKEMKQVKLVCSRWNEIGRDFTLIKRQKLVFNGLLYSNCFHLMFDHCRDHGLGYYNFEFKKVTLNEEFESYIESYGDKIHSLFFIYCEFSLETIEKLILKCVNLEKLRFNNCTTTSDESKIIVNMKENEISKRELACLEFSSCKWLTDFIFNLFMTVYPCVKKIVLDDVRMNCDYRVFRRFYPNHDNINEFASDLVMTYFAFYKTITRKCEHVEKISLRNPLEMRGPDDNDLLEFVSAPNIRLKKFRLINCDRPNLSDTFKSFITHQKNLTSVEFEWKMFNFENFKFLFEQIPNLESLAIHFNSQVIPVDDFIRILSKSSLKKFKCHISWYKFTSDGSIKSDGILTNNKLKYLHFSLMDIMAAQIPGDVIAKLLQVFCNLSVLNLHLKNLNRAHEVLIPELIFQKQVNLEKLILKGCVWINDSAFNRVELPRLEHLELNNCDITGKTILKCNFPSLKILYLRGCKPIADEIIALSRVTPLLEELRITDLVADNEVENLCRELKFLEKLALVCSIIRDLCLAGPPQAVFLQVPWLKCNIYWKNVDSCHIERPKIIFQCCPSLRYLRMHSYDIFYNYHEKRFILRKLTNGIPHIVPWESDAITRPVSNTDQSFNVLSFLYFVR